MDWKSNIRIYFYGDTKCKTLEDLYQAFKERLLKELEENGQLEKAKQDNCPYKEIVNLYHTILPNHPRVRELTAKRRTHIKARWSNGMEKNLNEFEGYFKAVLRSRFLCGKVDPPPGRKRFIADLDFLMRESTYVGILEGKYE